MRSIGTTCVVVLVILAAGCGELGTATLDAIANEAALLNEQMQPGSLEDPNGDGSGEEAGQVDPEEPGGDESAGETAEADEDEGTRDDVNGADTDDSADLSAVDLSSFSQFSFSRAPQVGFCPVQDEVFTAGIFANADGSHTLDVSILQTRVGGSGSCINTSDFRCATATQLQERTLTPAEVSAVTAAFSAVRVDDQIDPICQDSDVAPCLINQFAWDSFFVTDFECTTPRLHRDQANAIIDLLEQLGR